MMVECSAMRVPMWLISSGFKRSIRQFLKLAVTRGMGMEQVMARPRGGGLADGCRGGVWFRAWIWDCLGRFPFRSWSGVRSFGT